MNEEKAIILIKKYQQGTLSPKLEKRLNEWYLMYAAESKAELSQEQMEITVELLRSKLPLHKPLLTIRLWSRMVAAIAALVLITLGIYFFNANNGSADNRYLYAHDITPGKLGATLTLANGKKIELTEALNGELAKETGVIITKTADGQLVYEIKDVAATSDKTNTLSTAVGETYHVRLPDGTDVYLNAASALTYPTSFASKKQRRVELDGEGYFQVAKDKIHPFIVKTDQQEVEVLGTHFNINSYKNELNVKTTLLEGSVRVAFLSAPGKDGVARAGSRSNSNPLSLQGGFLPGGERSIVLKPNQQSVLNKSGDIKVQNIEAGDAIDWKMGYFMFNSEPLESIMNRLARWYNVQVEYQDEALKKETFFGKVGRYENIGKALDLLSGTDVVKFNIEGKKIIVSKKN